MKKEEAELELLKRQHDRVIVFCPLARALCVENCECYYPGKVLSNHRGELGEKGLYIQHDDWFVSSPGCTCHSLVGES